MGWQVGRRMRVVWCWVFTGSEHVGLILVVLLDNRALDWSRQGVPAVNDVLAHLPRPLDNSRARLV
jgi:hypothetical protein